MKMQKMFYDIFIRELKILYKNPIYLFAMVVFPLLVVFFFTSMLDEGQPSDMPVGIVDQDNTSVTRSLERRLDAFQMSRVVARYASVAEAREAVQRGDIYAFLYIPAGTTEGLLSNRQPKVTLFYSMTTLTSGNLLYKDLKTIAALGSAAVGQATLQAKGLTDRQIATLLQPIRVDLHQIANPWSDYNTYLTTFIVPGLLMLFIFLISAYSIGAELKFGRSKEWLAMADQRIVVAILAKFLPQTIIWLSIVYFYEYYVYVVLQFPCGGSAADLIMIGLLHVLSAQGFGIFAFGLTPSLRMSMSICSLWAMLSFSLAGTAFPLMAMDGPLQSASWLFPLRHYFVLLETCVFNGFPLLESWFHLVALVAFTLLPWFVMRKIKNAMLTYVYIP